LPPGPVTSPERISLKLSSVTARGSRPEELRDWSALNEADAT